MNKGFSIIELIVVLLISGLISSVVIPNYTKIQLAAKNHITKQFGHTLQLGLESYLLEHAQYPQQQNIETLIKTLHDQHYIKKKQTNPFTNSPYAASDSEGKMHYTSTSSTSYSIEIYGKNSSTPLLVLSN